MDSKEASNPEMLFFRDMMMMVILMIIEIIKLADLAELRVRIKFVIFQGRIRTGKIVLRKTPAAYVAALCHYSRGLQTTTRGPASSSNFESVP